MRDDRGNWYLLTGLVIGLALGLVYAWVISPVRFVDNAPAALREDFKDQYRILIAAAFSANQDLGRAQARLALLGDPDVYRVLASQAQQLLADGGSGADSRALGGLAAALRQASPEDATAAVTASASEATTPEAATTPTSGIASTSITLAPTVDPNITPTRTPLPSRTPTPTQTSLPTATATATPGLPFELVEQDSFCDPGLPGPLIQVITLDASGEPVPGVEILVGWSQGQEIFFTGLKPELGLGYADFTMAPGVVYTVQINDGGEPVTDLETEPCTAPSGESASNSWLLEFQQPE